jgi:hypothetical protein
MPKIFFDTDKAELRQESKEELDKLYSQLKSKPGFFIRISGHTIIRLPMNIIIFFLKPGLLPWIQYRMIIFRIKLVVSYKLI